MHQNQSNIQFGSDALQWLKGLLLKQKQEGIPAFLLTDANTHRLCFPALQTMLGAEASYLVHIVTGSGESEKNLENCRKIWHTLTENKAGRDAVLINLGGGMITDLGGFAASVYKRGIPTIHIPTSLLAMVDAAIGNKTAIDFEGFKNNIGTFYQADAILIVPTFLKTLPERELISGLAEVIKYGYIYQKELLENTEYQLNKSIDPMPVIKACVMAKQQIVAADPLETGYRKILNFGHTIGHAFESWSHEKGKGMLHGEAIAMGMYCELWLSQQLFNLPGSILDGYSSWYRRHFTPQPFTKDDYDRFFYFMSQDKKNTSGQLRFVLIEELAKPVFDVSVQQDLITESLNYFRKSFF